MNFRSNRLPSTLQELQWYWGKSVMADINFSRVVINEKKINFKNLLIILILLILLLIKYLL